jgi:cephalosporin hydroxylase
MLRRLLRRLALFHNTRRERRDLIPRGNQIVADFHRLYFNDVFDKRLRANWLGVEVLKYPTDLLVYQEIINEIRPDLIVETGTHHGGSALFFASILDLIGRGQVVSIDLNRGNNLPHHPRITYLVGSSTSEDIVVDVARRAEGLATVLVTLDSGHTKRHVAREIDIYRRFVTTGSYLIVEDTKLNGHPVFTRYEPDLGEGPMEAVMEFLAKDRTFRVDRSRERFFLTSNPNGFLLKIA